MDGVIGFLQDLPENLGLVASRMPQILDGLQVTLLATILGAALALVIAFVFGIAQVSKFMVVRGVARIFVEFFRGTSLVVQLFWLAFVLPQLPYPFGFRLEPLLVGVLALGLNYGAYAAEVVRGSIGSVPQGQYKAISALRHSPTRDMSRIVIPQTWALMIPSLSNLTIHLLNGSAIVGSVQLRTAGLLAASLTERQPDERARGPVLAQDRPRAGAQRVRGLAGPGAGQRRGEGRPGMSPDTSCGDWGHAASACPRLMDGFKV